MRRLLIAIALLIALSQAQAQIVETRDNYRDWGWDDVMVAENEFISLAVVPQAAGRILEYNLGDVPSLWINPDLFGKSYSNHDRVKVDEWRNFGGYRLVPLPITDCSINRQGDKAQRWPPPVVIGDAPYWAAIEENPEGQKEIVVRSGIQNLPVPQYDYQNKAYLLPESIDEQLQYERSLYIEPASSRVLMTHRLTNRGIAPVERGLMFSSQHVSESGPDQKDGENYVAYVPFDDEHLLPDGQPYEIMGDAESRWRYVHRNRRPLDKETPADVEAYYNDGNNWNGEVAPGVFEVEYEYDLMSGFHIVSSQSWLCYVNKTNNTAFVKWFEPYDDALTYEYGINASIFCSGMETGYLETEVLTPIYTLQPGEFFEYKENHGAAKIAATPVLEVNPTGVITDRLTYEGQQISGAYGVFVQGMAELRALDAKGKVKQTIALGAVDPLHAFVLAQGTEISSKARTLQLWVVQADGSEWLLDDLTL
ncbi:hypothetical protein [Reichenbachiella sp. MSK19-1]|uniref:hypothetical protein n=1 Tax=Reichenbachiella sp. MSK19-1 TaxID=1897631 RepID=UPI000E6D2A54|nr:hypothetical protein [Reichenbachiella sp. MSK19-1]RJE72423.1 hypothetical protein BGP76_00080 [Reichenbachiella sp. MSK19-1]